MLILMIFAYAKQVTDVNLPAVTHLLMRQFGSKGSG